MTKVTYKNEDPAAPKVTRAFGGKVFENGGSGVDIDDERFVEKAKANPYFSVEGEKKKEAKDDGPDVEKLQKAAEKEREEAKKARDEARAKRQAAETAERNARMAERDVTNARGG